MSGALKDWMFSLAGAAIVCSMASALAPEGRWRKITSLVCGMVMIIALISPVKSFSISTYGAELSKYRDAAGKAAEKSEEIGSRLNRTYIEDECEAYILDKAKSLGAHLTAQVTARWDTGGFWYPYEAKLVSDCSAEDRSRISGIMEAELGIPAERQYWSGAYE